MIIDTGNKVATSISGNLVTRLNLDSNIDYTETEAYNGVGTGTDGNRISGKAYTIMINVKIRHMTFSVKALYDVTPENIDLLIGMPDIITKLLRNGFTLGE